ncbi:hypothetical protein BaRGS_00021713, partial [Batillaria attramentaria]
DTTSVNPLETYSLALNSQTPLRRRAFMENVLPGDTRFTRHASADSVIHLRHAGSSHATLKLAKDQTGSMFKRAARARVIAYSDCLIYRGPNQASPKQRLVEADTL